MSEVTSNVSSNRTQLENLDAMKQQILSHMIYHIAFGCLSTMGNTSGISKDKFVNMTKQVVRSKTEERHLQGQVKGVN